MNLDEIKFDAQGLIPVIVQDADTGEVLTLAYMSRDSLQKSLATGETWFYSRSRQQLWHKGETSGNTQRIVTMTLDCDRDALLVKVKPAGPACHTGQRTCFHNRLHGEAPQPTSLGAALSDLFAVIQERQRDMPENSYTAQLLTKGIAKIAQKVGEEGVEVVIAALHESNNRLTEEMGDLLYHVLVLMAAKEVTPAEVAQVLESRRR